MKITEARFGGYDSRIYSGNYLIAKGYNRVIRTDHGFMIEIAQVHWNRRYMIAFPPIEQLSSQYERFHHTSDIHAIVYKQLVNIDELKSGMYYIPIDNVDYYPHNRTDIKRQRPGKIEITRGPAPSKPPTKIFAVIGHRPAGRDMSRFDIRNNNVYGPAKEFFITIFNRAIKKYGKEEVVLLTNGTIGFAQLAQSVAISMGIAVWLHIPFKGFGMVWKRREADTFYALAKESFVTDLCHGEMPQAGSRIKCIMRSNLLLVEKCHQLLSVYDGSTRDEVRKALIYATQRGVHVTNFFPSCRSADNLKPYVKDYYRV